MSALTHCLYVLGRCSIVNFNGKCLLDIYAQPGAPVTDYRYRHSGLRPQDFKSAVPFDVAQAQIKSHIEVRIYNARLKYLVVYLQVIMFASVLPLLFVWTNI